MDNITSFRKHFAVSVLILFSWIMLKNKTIIGPKPSLPLLANVYLGKGTLSAGYNAKKNVVQKGCVNSVLEASRNVHLLFGSS